MAPHSKSNMGSEVDEDLLKISDKLQQINLEEASTYDIDDDDDDDQTINENLKDCTTIKEKGPIPSNTFNNNRVTQYERNSREPRSINNNNNQNILDNNVGFNPSELFNNLNQQQLINQILQTLDEIDQSESSSSSSLSSTNSPPYYHQDINQDIINQDNNENNIIPESVLVLNIPVYQSNIAENKLSEYTDENKKLKQEIWILVNIEHEHQLLLKLKTRILNQRFNLIDLNYIYAIIIRLMKDGDGKQLLIDYLSTVDVLSGIALKQNVLLMNFLLEVHQNLSIPINRVGILNHIINNKNINLTEIFAALINYKYNNNYVFDVNSVDYYGNNILMNLVKNIANGNYESHIMYMMYLDVILSRLPDITHLSDDGKNIYHHAIYWRCDQYIIDKINSYYNIDIINGLMAQRDNDGYQPYDYFYNNIY